MNILLLSLGGGGGNILRSVKALYQRDLIIAQEADPAYANRLKNSVTARFVDTNRFSVVDIPDDERVLIGAATTRHLGARHDPDVAHQAFEESRGEIEELIGRYSTIIVIAAGGKGTGTGTIMPVTRVARQQKKLVIPIFVRPSFERHEVEKYRFDRALAVSRQLDEANIRFIEILNDRGYVDADPQPQSVVWERMNVPIARALRGLLYVLWDLSQVDPSDLSSLFAGQGRLRIGFSELDPASGADPGDEDVGAAVKRCWDNPYCNFSEPVGTSLICIQGVWSNIADAKIKGGLAAHAVAANAKTYNPLYARGFQIPKPWGVTALFAEYTGSHPPIDIDLSLGSVIEAGVPDVPPADVEPVPLVAEVAAPAQPDAGHPSTAAALGTTPSGTFWDLALAINRSDPAALAVAKNGADESVLVDADELRKLLGTVWFRGVFPRLSHAWRERLLDVLAEGIEVPDQLVKVGRRDIRLREMGHDALKEVFSKSSLTEAARSDVRLLMTVGTLWGADSLSRFQFVNGSRPQAPSKLSSIIHGLRR